MVAMVAVESRLVDMAHGLTPILADPGGLQTIAFILQLP
jgi:hypothetical protein